MNKQIDEKFSQLLQDADSQESTALQSLSEQLEKEKIDRKEERLLWIIALVVLFDIMCLKDSQNWSLPIIIGIFESTVIFVLSHKWSVRPIELLFAMLYELFQKKK